MLKPLDQSLEAMAWQARELTGIATGDGFRLSLPLSASDGAMVVDGWTAWPWQAGSHLVRRWPDIIAAGDRFHTAIRHLPKPDVIDQRHDRWARADRIAWGDEAAGNDLESPLTVQLLAWSRPVTLDKQLIHGDLTCNVLFQPGLPPAIIDLSLYWRPAVYAAAVVVADALAFEGAGRELLATQADRPGFGQCLLRAINFRLITDLLAGLDATSAEAPYREAFRLTCELVSDEER